MPHSSSDLQIKKADTLLARPVPRAREVKPQDLSDYSTFDRADILFALFKHKRKILVGTIVGLLVAAGVFVFYPVVYKSDAKLLVRYLVERTSVDNDSAKSMAGGYAPATDTIIGSEMEILSSWDLAVQTAEGVGPKRILPGNKRSPTKEEAAAVIASGLDVATRKGSNIILVSYQNRDPALTTLVLDELVNRYFNKHLEVHRSAGAFDFVTQQTDQVHARLNQAEDALRDLKEKVGIVSLDDGTAALNTEAQKVDDQLRAAQADFDEQRARVRLLHRTTGGVTVMGGEDITTDSESEADGDTGNSGPETSPSPTAPPEAVDTHQLLADGLDKLHKQEADLFARYGGNSKRARVNQAKIDRANKKLRELEKRYPDLETDTSKSSAELEKDSATEAARLAGLKAKKEALAARLKEIQQKRRDLAQVAPRIADLERQKELEEANYKYFEATLEKARVDEALDPSKIPNISAVQRPSPPRVDTGKRNKVAGLLAVSGLGLSICLILFKELIMDRTIRRPSQVEKFVGTSSLMSIPYNWTLNGAACKSTQNGKTKAIIPATASRANLAPWDSEHFIRPYAEAIRDRLGLYFELNNLTHKPKLVGVAGLAEASGTSTLAAGLAAALSETNEGKVLLVDVNLGPDQVHPFFKGKPAYPLNTALKPTDSMAAAAENLYLATVGSPNAGPAQLGLKKFFDLMPNLKASDFDYIIFDMPPLDQTSPTWGMAPFMDKMLLVVEAEKSTRDAVKRIHRKLTSERDNVSLVVNKVHSYAPKRLELEA